MWGCTFSAKYGKEFISSAIELRPQCGVSRLLVEKLSATAPDGQAKIKVLSALADEHNVKWDPDLFEEKRSGGPSSIKNENELYSGAPRFEDAEVHAHPSSSSPLNSVQQHAKTPGAENLPSADASSASTKFEPKAGPAGGMWSSRMLGLLNFQFMVGFWGSIPKANQMLILQKVMPNLNSFEN